MRTKILPEATATDSLERIYKAQQLYFERGETRAYRFRKQQLQKLKTIIKQHESEIHSALRNDFDKPEFESYVSEVGFVYEEINHVLKRLDYWMKPKKVSTPWVHFPSYSKVVYEPKGVALIIGPWNYPFQLLISPLVAAIAAGNTVVLKPSELTPHTALLIEKMISENFPEEYLAVVQGEGHKVVPALMNNFRFDHIFFTGSVPVGRKIAEMAAPKLVPTTLELGGKSPAVVDASANLKVAARRIAFGKWINAGQTCVAPDYLLVHESIKAEFVRELQKTVGEFYGSNALENRDYASIINQGRYTALKAYLTEGQIIFGGKTDDEKLRIEPTLIEGVKMSDKLMQEEIFGPILPLLEYAKPEEAVNMIKENPFPLSLYLFTKDSRIEKTFMENIRFGGGAVNNTVVHLSNPNLPFGGIGTSGYGNYHGKYGFKVFSYEKAIMKTGTWFDLKPKYPPYSSRSMRLVKLFMK